MHRVLFTFDVEDFINPRSIYFLYIILKLLKKYKFEGLFFITGHMAEKLRNFPEILDMLKFHLVGYHSSSHSVRPTIFEYTDTRNCEEAYSKSVERETASINPLTGKIDGEGGIEFLRSLFPKKEIVSFRAPGLCWSPPHLDALVSLGIKFDFSAAVSQAPVYYRGITFYPYPVSEIFRFSDYYTILNRILKHNMTVLSVHPSWFANQGWWDSIYYKGNPKEIITAEPKPLKRTLAMLGRFELLLTYIKILQNMKSIRVACDLSRSKIKLSVTRFSIQKIYEKSIWWPRTLFDYEPKFLRSHFFNYFGFSKRQAQIM